MEITDTHITLQQLNEAFSPDKIKKIISQNKTRLIEISTPYDPISGEGSCVCERTECYISDSGYDTLYLPKIMVEKETFIRELISAGSFTSYAQELQHRTNNIFTADEVKFTYVKIRVMYDFEFWAASFVYIKEKVSEESMARGNAGGNILFRLNRGQRKLLKAIYTLWLANKPIRIILLKARQWGGSTLTQIFMMWMQLVHHNQWNSVICAHVESTARIVQGMYNNALRHYPYILDDHATATLELTPYEGSQKTRYIKSRMCRVSIGSAEKPENLRGEDLCMAHFSEVGLFKATEGKKPEDIIQSIESGIPLARDTVIVYESTAKGVGNMFHREWIRAKEGRSNYTPVFVAWYDIDTYSTSIDDYKAFILTLTEDEELLFNEGATLEQIAWYREKSKAQPDKWRFVSEYPSNDIEAFQSTGNRYFNIHHVDKLRKHCMPPSLIADIVANDTHGQRALENIRIQPNINGKFSIWEIPDSIKMINDRYVVVVDVNKGSSKNADNGIICVFDRYYMSEGGVPEVVAEWCGHIEMRYFIWIAVQVAKLYHNAHLVIESNTPDTAGQGGFELESVFDEIAGYYDNLFYRTNPQAIKNNLPTKYGFQTNRATKLEVCSHQQIVIAKGMYIERCIEAVDEHDTFEVKDNGKLGAVDGCHDDRLITRAIGVWVCYNKLDLPILANNANTNYTTSRPVVSEATL